VKCGSSAVQTGTVKIRTLGANHRTLGTAAFACPKNRKRTVHFTISGTSAKFLRNQHQTHANVYVVARDTSGDSATHVGRMTIVA
jgi:hypothetical protein